MVESDEPLLFCELENLKIFIALLKAINLSECVTIIISPNGLKFSSQESRSLQATAYVPKDVFKVYSLNGNPVSLCLNLSIFLNCLNEYSASKDEYYKTPVIFKYQSLSSPFEIEINELGVLTKCVIRTKDAEDHVDFNFNPNDVVNKFVMKSEYMKETFLEFDSSSSYIEITTFPEQEIFKILTKGRYGTSTVEFNKKSEAVEFWLCSEKQEFRYRMQLVKPSTKALSVSKKFSIRIDHRGVLSLQHLVIGEDEQPCFFEFLCLPEIVV